MKKVLFSLIASLALVSSARADIYDSGDIENFWASTTAGPQTHVFVLPALTSINSIGVDLASTWIGDLDVNLVGPGGQTFNLIDNPNGTTGGNSADLGLVAGSGANGNEGRYVFTTAGAEGWIAGYNAPGTYNALVYTAGGAAAGSWTLTWNDPIGGDGGSVGHLVIDYTPDAIPEPGSALALLGLAGLGLIRRRS